MSKEIYDNDALEKFRFVQRMAYEAITEVKAELYEGITEKEAADRINQKVKDKGGNYLKWREK